MDEEAVLMIAWNGLTQLLNRPFGSRVRRPIAMKNAARADLLQHKNVNDADGNSDHEVAREKSSGVYKCVPALRVPMGPRTMDGQ